MRSFLPLRLMTTEVDTELTFVSGELCHFCAQTTPDDACAFPCADLERDQCYACLNAITVDPETYSSSPKMLEDYLCISCLKRAKELGISTCCWAHVSIIGNQTIVHE
jgi:hypothetical protein